MDKKTAVQNMLKHGSGIAKTSDFAAMGINNFDVAALCKEGFIERVRRGVYRLPGEQISEERLLRELLPQGIVCVESALFHYGYSDFAPRTWSVAVPRTASRAVGRVREVPIKAYYIKDEYLTLGKTEEVVGGAVLPIYDRERTVCDCFKYRTKLDSETFNKALNAYVADTKKNLANLSAYAKKMKLYTQVMNVMEVLFSG